MSIVGYSPLGRGLLVTKWKTADDIPDGDIRKGPCPSSTSACPAMS